MLKEGIFTTRDLLLGFPAFVHEYCLVESLPVFDYDDSRWECFIELIDKELKFFPESGFHFYMQFDVRSNWWKIRLREHKDIELAFLFVVVIDPDTGRMRPDKESRVGSYLHKEYAELFEQMFVLGMNIEGFYEFSEAFRRRS
ncbi:MAG TPA: hypothetical protein VIJ29_02970 [Candidatus Paceibacterota bacterium]